MGIRGTWSKGGRICFKATLSGRVMLYINVIFLKTARSIENFREIKCGKLFHWKNPFCLYLTIPPQHLQPKESGFVQTPQCKFFWPSVRAINHFAVRRAALCGQHVLFLTARRCFDDGWQSSMSGSCLLTLVIGGNVSEPVGMSEQPNYEGVENAKPMLRGVSKDGASLPFLSKLPRTPASSAKLLQSLHSWGWWVSAGGERQGGGIGWPWPHELPHPGTWKEALLLSNKDKFKLESLKWVLIALGLFIIARRFIVSSPTLCR